MWYGTTFCTRHRNSLIIDAEKVSAFAPYSKITSFHNQCPNLKCAWIWNDIRAATLIFALCVGTASCDRVNNLSFMCAEWINIGSASGSLGQNLPTCSALMGVTAKRWTRRRRTFARRERAQTAYSGNGCKSCATADRHPTYPLGAHSRTYKWALILR